MRKTETLNLRVSSEFKQKLIEEAKKDKRSVTNYLEAILTTLWKEQSSNREGKQIRGKVLHS
jgi:predicted HicB family RNase H-like nuclease